MVSELIQREANTFPLAVADFGHTGAVSSNIVPPPGASWALFLFCVQVCGVDGAVALLCEAAAGKNTDPAELVCEDVHVVV